MFQRSGVVKVLNNLNLPFGHVADGSPVIGLLGDQAYNSLPYCIAKIANPSTIYHSQYNQWHCDHRLAVEQTYSRVRKWKIFETGHTWPTTEIHYISSVAKTGRLWKTSTLLCAYGTSWTIRSTWRMLSMTTWWEQVSNLQRCGPKYIPSESTTSKCIHV